MPAAVAISLNPYIIEGQSSDSSNDKFIGYVDGVRRDPNDVSPIGDSGNQVGLHWNDPYINDGEIVSLTIIPNGQSDEYLPDQEISLTTVNGNPAAQTFSNITFSLPQTITPTIIINEIFLKSDGTSNAQGRWFELFNISDTPIDICTNDSGEPLPQIDLLINDVTSPIECIQSSPNDNGLYPNYMLYPQESYLVYFDVGNGYYYRENYIDVINDNSEMTEHYGFRNRKKTISNEIPWDNDFDLEPVQEHLYVELGIYKDLPMGTCSMGTCSDGYWNDWNCTNNSQCGIYSGFSFHHNGDGDMISPSINENGENLIQLINHYSGDILFEMNIDGTPGTTWVTELNLSTLNFGGSIEFTKTDHPLGDCSGGYECDNLPEESCNNNESCTWNSILEKVNEPTNWRSLKDNENSEISYPYPPVLCEDVNLANNDGFCIYGSWGLYYGYPNNWDDYDEVSFIGDLENYEDTGIGKWINPQILNFRHDSNINQPLNFGTPFKKNFHNCEGECVAFDQCCNLPGNTCSDDYYCYTDIFYDCLGIEDGGCTFSIENNEQSGNICSNHDTCNITGGGFQINDRCTDCNNFTMCFGQPSGDWLEYYHNNEDICITSDWFLEASQRCLQDLETYEVGKTYTTLFPYAMDPDNPEHINGECVSGFCNQGTRWTDVNLPYDVTGSYCTQDSDCGEYNWFIYTISISYGNPIWDNYIEWDDLYTYNHNCFGCNDVNSLNYDPVNPPTVDCRRVDGTNTDCCTYPVKLLLDYGDVLQNNQVKVLIENQSPIGNIGSLYIHGLKLGSINVNTYILPEENFQINFSNEEYSDGVKIDITDISNQPPLQQNTTPTLLLTLNYTQDLTNDLGNHTIYFSTDETYSIDYEYINDDVVIFFGNNCTDISNNKGCNSIEEGRIHLFKDCIGRINNPGDLGFGEGIGSSFNYNSIGCDGICNSPLCNESGDIVTCTPYDYCSNCDGDCIQNDLESCDDIGCDGECSELEFDECEICDGDNSTCTDCAETVNPCGDGTTNCNLFLVNDDCGECGGDNSDMGCNGECFSGLVEDCSGVCDGNDIMDCNNNCSSNSIHYIPTNEIFQYDSSGVHMDVGGSPPFGYDCTGSNCGGDIMTSSVTDGCGECGGSCNPSSSLTGCSDGSTGFYCDCNEHYTDCNGGCTCDVDDVSDASCTYIIDECGTCTISSTLANCSDLGDTYTCGGTYCPDGTYGCDTGGNCDDGCDLNNGCGCGTGGATPQACGQCTSDTAQYCSSTGTGCVVCNTTCTDMGVCSECLDGTYGDSDSGDFGIGSDVGSGGSCPNGASNVGLTCSCGNYTVDGDGDYVSGSKLTCDCAGICGGTDVVDDCGVCQAPANANLSPDGNAWDCTGLSLPAGTYGESSCGAQCCWDQGGACDCNGNTYDQCGNCGGGDAQLYTCAEYTSGNCTQVQFYCGSIGAGGSSYGDVDTCYTLDECDACGVGNTIGALWDCAHHGSPECGAPWNDQCGDPIGGCGDGSCPSMYPASAGTENHKPDCNISGFCECTATTWDCFGDCGGSAVNDPCGQCDGSGVVQDCGCGTDGTLDVEDDSVCGSGDYCTSGCAVGSYCDCACNTADACGNCDGPNYNCYGTGGDCTVNGIYDCSSQQCDACQHCGNDNPTNCYNDGESCSQDNDCRNGNCNECSICGADHSPGYTPGSESSFCNYGDGSNPYACGWHTDVCSYPINCSNGDYDGDGMNGCDASFETCSNGYCVCSMFDCDGVCCTSGSCTNSDNGCTVGDSEYSCGNPPTDRPVYCYPDTGSDLGCCNLGSEIICDTGDVTANYVLMEGCDETDIDDLSVCSNVQTVVNCGCEWNNFGADCGECCESGTCNTFACGSVNGTDCSGYDISPFTNSNGTACGDSTHDNGCGESVYCYCGDTCNDEFPNCTNGYCTCDTGVYGYSSSYQDGTWICCDSIDNCSVCGGDNSDMDCEGVCGGTNWESDCGCVASDNDGNDCDDCAGEPNGPGSELTSDGSCCATGDIDSCGICDSGSDTLLDCPSSTTPSDPCNTGSEQYCSTAFSPYGDISSCSIVDDCGICDGPNDDCESTQNNCACKGCTDSDTWAGGNPSGSCNYDASADYDDNSCTYPSNCTYGCGGTYCNSEAGDCINVSTCTNYTSYSCDPQYYCASFGNGGTSPSYGLIASCSNYDATCGCGDVTPANCSSYNGYQYCGDQTYCAGHASLDHDDVCIDNSYDESYCNCEGTPHNGSHCDCSGNVEDECGECGGDTTTCQDCAGVPNGSSLTFTCGENNLGDGLGGGDASSYPCGSGGCSVNVVNVCNPYLNDSYTNGATCCDNVPDCNGECGGTAFVDNCGTCTISSTLANCSDLGDTYTCGGTYCPDGTYGCDTGGNCDDGCDLNNGCGCGNVSSSLCSGSHPAGGTACDDAESYTYCGDSVCDGNCLSDCPIFDECGVCGGNGIAEGKCDCAGNTLDCNGDCDGLALLDACGICVGGNSGNECPNGYVGPITCTDLDVSPLSTNSYVHDCEMTCNGNKLYDVDGISSGCVPSEFGCENYCCILSDTDCTNKCISNAGYIGDSSPHNLSCAPSCSGVNCNGNYGCDCDNTCNGSLMADCAEVCDGNSVFCDDGLCTGNCGGPCDCNGICNGSSITDCDGTCYDPSSGESPTYVLDCVGNCSDDLSSYIGDDDGLDNICDDGTFGCDCNNTCNGTYRLGCDTICREVPYSTDVCGVCDGGGIPCVSFNIDEFVLFDDGNNQYYQSSIIMSHKSDVGDITLPFINTIHDIDLYDIMVANSYQILTDDGYVSDSLTYTPSSSISFVNGDFLSGSFTCSISGNYFSVFNCNDGCNYGDDDICIPKEIPIFTIYVDVTSTELEIPDGEEFEDYKYLYIDFNDQFGESPIIEHSDTSLFNYDGGEILIPNYGKRLVFGCTDIFSNKMNLESVENGNPFEYCNTSDCGCDMLFNNSNNCTTHSCTENTHECGEDVGINCCCTYPIFGITGLRIHDFDANDYIEYSIDDIDQWESFNLMSSTDSLTLSNGQLKVLYESSDFGEYSDNINQTPNNYLLKEVIFPTEACVNIYNSEVLQNINSGENCPDGHIWTNKRSIQVTQSDTGHIQIFESEDWKTVMPPGEYTVNMMWPVEDADGNISTMDSSILSNSMTFSIDYIGCSNADSSGCNYIDVGRCVGTDNCNDHTISQTCNSGGNGCTWESYTSLCESCCLFQDASDTCCLDTGTCNDCNYPELTYRWYKDNDMDGIGCGDAVYDLCKFNDDFPYGNPWSEISDETWIYGGPSSEGNTTYNSDFWTVGEYGLENNIYYFSLSSGEQESAYLIGVESGDACTCMGKNHCCNETVSGIDDCLETVYNEYDCNDECIDEKVCTLISYVPDSGCSDLCKPDFNNDGESDITDVDICGECPGFSETFTLEDGTVFNYSYNDPDGEKIDCNGVCKNQNGGAYGDNCGVCSGGSTDHVAGIHSDDCDPSFCWNNYFVCINDTPIINIYHSDPTCNDQCTSDECVMMSSDYNNYPHGSGTFWNNNCTGCDGVANSGSHFDNVCAYGDSCCEGETGSQSECSSAGDICESNDYGNAIEVCHQYDNGLRCRTVCHTECVGENDPIDGCPYLDYLGGDSFIIGPSTGCSGICNSMDLFDDLGNCCAGVTLVNAYPDLDGTPSVDGVYSGEIGFCSELQESIINEDLCNDAGGDWIPSTPIQVCSTLGSGPFEYSGQDQIISDGTTFNYYINTDDCFGYIDDCGSCWSFSECPDGVDDCDNYNIGLDCAGGCNLSDDAKPFIDDCGECMNPSCQGGEINSDHIWYSLGEGSNTWSVCPEGQIPSNALWNSTCTGCTNSDANNYNNCTDSDGNSISCIIPCDGVVDFINVNFCGAGCNFSNCCCEYNFGNSLSSTIVQTDTNGDGVDDGNLILNGYPVNSIIHNGNIISPVQLNWTYTGPGMSNYECVQFEIYRNNNISTCPDYFCIGCENSFTHIGTINASDTPESYSFEDLFEAEDELSIPDTNVFLSYYIKISGQYSYSNRLGWTSGWVENESGEYSGGDCVSNFNFEDGVYVSQIAANVSIVSPDNDSTFNSNDQILLEVDYNNIPFTDSQSSFNVLQLHVFDGIYTCSVSEGEYINSNCDDECLISPEIDDECIFDDTLGDPIISQLTLPIESWDGYDGNGNVGDGFWCNKLGENNIKYIDQFTCTSYSTCESCDEYHNLIFDITNQIWVLPGTTESVYKYIKIQWPSPAGDYFDTDDGGIPFKIFINPIHGCTNPSACDCSTCYICEFCTDCGGDVIDDCFDYGYYKPGATVDSCLEDTDIKCTYSYSGCTCIGNCVFPNDGCMDSGNNNGGICTDPISVDEDNICNDDSDCGDNELCGCDLNDDGNRYCHVECFYGGSVSVCNDYGGTCIVGPTTYESNQYTCTNGVDNCVSTCDNCQIFGSIIPDIPSVGYYYCKHSADTGDATPTICNGISEAETDFCINDCLASVEIDIDICNDSSCGSWATEDNNQCVYIGCKEEGAINYIGNTYSNQSMNYWLNTPDECVYSYQYRLKYQISVNNQLIQLSNGETSGYIDAGICNECQSDGSEFNLDIQLPLSDNFELYGIPGGTSGDFKKTLIISIVGMDGSDGYVWIPSNDMPGDTISKFIFNNGENAWNIPDNIEIDNTCGEYGDELCIVSVCSDNDHLGDSCNDDGVTNNGESCDCAPTMYEFIINEYCVDGLAGCDGASPEIENMEFTVALNDPDQLDENGIVSKTLNVRLLRNNYSPMIYMPSPTDVSMNIEDFIETANGDIVGVESYSLDAIDVDGDDFIINIEVMNPNEDNFYVTPSTINSSDLINNVVEFDIVAKNTTGLYNIRVSLIQPSNNELLIPNDSWSYVPLYDELILYEYFQVNIIDTRGPYGDISVKPIENFGISNNLFRFKAIGSDTRTILGGGDIIDQSYSGYVLPSITYKYGSPVPKWLCGGGTEVDVDGNVIPCNPNISDNSYCDGSTDECYGLSENECTGMSGCSWYSTAQCPTTNCELNVDFDASNLCQDASTYSNITIYMGYPSNGGIIDDDINGIISVLDDDFNQFYTSNSDNLYIQVGDEDSWEAATSNPLGSGIWEDDSGDEYNCNELVEYSYENVYNNTIIPNSEYTNPNTGGWVTRNSYDELTNSNGNMMDTIWKYEFNIYNSSDELIFSKIFKDWDSWNDLLIDYTPPPIIDSNIHKFISSGVVFEFPSRGVYTINVTAYDLYYDPDENSGTNSGNKSTNIEVDIVIPILPTLPSIYLPWSGINIPLSNISVIESYNQDILNLFDIDKRQSLGCFYYDSDNIESISWDVISKDKYSGGFSTTMEELELENNPQDYNDTCDSQFELDLMTSQTIKIRNFNISEGNNIGIIIGNSGVDILLSENEWKVLGTLDASELSYTYYDESFVNTETCNIFGDILSGGCELHHTVKFSIEIMISNINYYPTTLEITDGANNVRGFKVRLPDSPENGWVNDEWISIENLEVYSYYDEGDTHTNWYSMERLEIYRSGCDGGYGLNFSPDVDARTPLSMRGELSTVTKYYDRNENNDEFTETSVPAEVQFYFYRRKNGNMFTEREITPFPPKSDTYVGFIDWDDGSPIEFESEPKLIGNGKSYVLTHNYDRSGIYNISGYMFRVVYEDASSADTVLGVSSFKKFNTRIHLNGDNEIYIPYDSPNNVSGSTPIIGGTSEFSSYIRTIKRQLGYVGDMNVPFDIQFNQYKDKIDAEYALSQVYDNIGSEMSHYTGSIYSGSVDGDGILNGDSVLIHQGSYKNYNELGNDPGDIDISNTMFVSSGNLPMWKLLGFTGSDASLPDNDRYWKNIIPSNYQLTSEYIDGVSISDGSLEINDTQGWINGYYYPVIPTIDSYGMITGNIQNKIPFGEKLDWDGEDAAPITDNSFTHPYLELFFTFESMDDDIINDNAGFGNKGIFITDYRVQYDENTNEPNDTDSLFGSDISTEDGAF